MSTISARQCQMLQRAFENLGLDATDIARGAGLEEGRLEEPSARIAQEQFRLLIATAERASDDPLVVLRAARTSGAPGGILFYLALSQDTLRDGVLKIARFARLAEEALTVSLEERTAVGLRANRLHGQRPPLRAPLRNRVSRGSLRVAHPRKRGRCAVTERGPLPARFGRAPGGVRRPARVSGGLPLRHVLARLRA